MWQFVELNLKLMLEPQPVPNRLVYTIQKAFAHHHLRQLFQRKKYTNKSVNKKFLI